MLNRIKLFCLTAWSVLKLVYETVSSTIKMRNIIFILLFNIFIYLFGAHLVNDLYVMISGRPLVDPLVIT